MKRHLLLVAALSLAGCAEELPERWFSPLQFEPLDLDGQQVYVSSSAQRAVVVDPVRTPDGVGLDIRVQEAGQHPGAAGVSSDAASYYVVDEERRELHITNASTGTKQRLELDSAFDRIAVDPAGDFLLLYFSGASDGQVVARNLNEIGIVDLRGDAEATFLTLSSRPIAVEFAPAFDLAGDEQRIAVVSSVNEVTVLDLNELEEPDDALREVPLTISEADEVKNPVSIAFDTTPDDDNPDVARVYVLASASNDITEISLQPAVLPDAPRKLDLAVNQLAAGHAPSRMMLLELPIGTRMLAIDSRQPRFTLVDVTSGESATFDLPMTQPAQELLYYETTVEVDGEPVPERRVLAWSPNQTIVSVIRPETIAIEGDEPTLGRSVEAIRLERAPSKVQLADGLSDRAIAFHAGVSAGFTILDLRKNNDIPIQGGSLSDVYFDGEFAYAVFQSLPNLTVFGLDGHPTNFDLPQIGRDVYLDVEDALLLVRHDDPAGSFTVLDANDPRIENASTYRNVFLHQLLDQEITR